MKTPLWLPAGQSPPCFKAFELKKPPNKALILRSNSFSLKLLYHYLPPQGLYWSSPIFFFRITGEDKISLSPYFGMEYLPNKSNKHCIWRIYNGLVSYLWETAACCSTPFMKHLAWRVPYCSSGQGMIYDFGSRGLQFHALWPTGDFCTVNPPVKLRPCSDAVMAGAITLCLNAVSNLSFLHCCIFNAWANEDYLNWFNHLKYLCCYGSLQVIKKLLLIEAMYCQSQCLWFVTFSCYMTHPTQLHRSEYF